MQWKLSKETWQAWIVRGGRFDWHMEGDRLRRGLVGYKRLEHCSASIVCAICIRNLILHRLTIVKTTKVKLYRLNYLDIS